MQDYGRREHVDQPKRVTDVAMQTTVAATDSPLCGTSRSSFSRRRAMAPASSAPFVVVVAVAEGSAFKARGFLNIPRFCLPTPLPPPLPAETILTQQTVVGTYQDGVSTPPAIDKQRAPKIHISAC
jgi:hypothetical protein